VSGSGDVTAEGGSGREGGDGKESGSDECGSCGEGKRPCNAGKAVGGAEGGASEFDAGQGGGRGVGQVGPDCGEQPADQRLDYQCPDEHADHPCQLRAQERTDRHANGAEESGPKGRASGVLDDGGDAERQVVTVRGDEAKPDPGGNEGGGETEDRSCCGPGRRLGDEHLAAGGSREVGERGRVVAGLTAGDDHTQHGGEDHRPTRHGGDGGKA
jgi:hypothetical protein